MDEAHEDTEESGAAGVSGGAGVQARLDRLSARALAQAGRVIAGLRLGPVQLAQVNVAVELDLAHMSDAQAVDAWAEAIVDAVLRAEQQHSDPARHTGSQARREPSAPSADSPPPSPPATPIAPAIQRQTRTGTPPRPRRRSASDPASGRRPQAGVLEPVGSPLAGESWQAFAQRVLSGYARHYPARQRVVARQRLMQLSWAYPGHSPNPALRYQFLVPANLLASDWTPPATATFPPANAPGDLSEADTAAAPAPAMQSAPPPNLALHADAAPGEGRPTPVQNFSPAPTPAPTPTPPLRAERGDVASMDLEQRFMEVMRRALHYMQGETRAQFAALLAPESLAIMAGLFAAGVAAQFIPIGGEIIDLGIFLYGVYTLGHIALEAGSSLMACIRITAGAKTEAELEDAAQHPAHTVALVGVQGLTALLHKVEPAAKRGMTRAIQSRLAPRTASTGAGETPNATTADASGKAATQGERPSGAEPHDTAAVPEQAHTVPPDNVAPPPPEQASAPPEPTAPRVCAGRSKARLTAQTMWWGSKMSASGSSTPSLPVQTQLRAQI